MSEYEWERKLEHWLKIAKNHAVAKGERIRAEHMLKAVKSIAMCASEEEKVTAQEREAYASEAYAQAVERLAQAAQLEQELAARLEAGRIHFELLRTDAATRRAEMTLR